MTDRVVPPTPSHRALSRLFLDDVLRRHPLPWLTELDWTVEIYDANKRLVAKCQTGAEADQLIAYAEAVQLEAQRAHEIVEAMFSP
jgi:hypothetical protein